MVIAGDTKLALHRFHLALCSENTYPVIGNGCIDRGIDMLESKGISAIFLKISGNAHIVMPYRKSLDGVHEKSRQRILLVPPSAVSVQWTR